MVSLFLLFAPFAHVDEVDGPPHERHGNETGLAVNGAVDKPRN
jgi:hypothetical protein